ncbi:hypothetical protein [Bosea sp. PAMC 26642]|uniref:hypothetical protein n=1 Tax=Bosea sp. (strain PAMC 26642) TaxID=1792307 RepID=UPI0007705429|nr:hypothetical protein [Bosea sp. PAMC 26642]AMJ60968.1 hypothetical protein AXW83_12260 [Bosea sp. PAMC 26642]
MLTITPERLRQLVRAGHLPKAQRNQYALVPVVQGYLNFLRDPARNGRTAADRRLTEARVRQIDASMAREAAELVPAEEAIAFARLFCAELLGRVEEYAATYDEPMASRMIAGVDAIRANCERLIVEFDESRGDFA